MKSIMNGGATTIRVWHSIAQLKSMCNGILWLLKGEQVEFTDDMAGICARYQDFSANKYTIPQK